jgi:hypothetical protein
LEDDLDSFEKILLIIQADHTIHYHLEFQDGSSSGFLCSNEGISTESGSSCGIEMMRLYYEFREQCSRVKKGRMASGFRIEENAAIL